MKTVVKLIVALATVAGLSGSSAVAQGAQKQVTYFYDDESETNVVGGLLIYCNGSRVRWGEFTVYSETTEYTCP